MANAEKLSLIYAVDEPKHYMRIYEWHDRKFKIVSEHTNGDPLGFNYKCALSIMVPDGTWKGLEDNRSLQIKDWHNEYVLNNGDARIAKANKSAHDAFVRYIKTVY